MTLTTTTSVASKGVRSIGTQSWENDLWRETVPWLLALAKHYNVVGRHAMRKPELIKVLLPIVNSREVPHWPGDRVGRPNV